MDSSSLWQILYVEDDEVLRRQVSDALQEEYKDTAAIQVISSLPSALEDIETRRYDLLILDVFQGKPDVTNTPFGAEAHEYLRRVRFTPTIFYTALPSAVAHFESPFVKVIGKGGRGLASLINAIQHFIDSGFLHINRGISRHIESVLADYMQNFVGPSWGDLFQTTDKNALAYLSARRLSMSLSSNYIPNLATNLGKNNEHVPELGEDLAHRMQYYVLPPVSNDFLMGDILYGTINNQMGYWVILTPSCDLVTRKTKNDQGFPVKAEHVIVASCALITDFPEYTEWRGEKSPNSKKRKALEALLKNKRNLEGQQPERFHYLPGVLSIPHLIVDFQKIQHIPYSEIADLIDHRKASLDSPYAEQLLARYTRYSSRFGTPDLDISEVLDHLNSLPFDSSTNTE